MRTGFFATLRSKRTIAWPRSERAVAIGATCVVFLVCVTSGWDQWRARHLTLADNDRELASLASAIAEHTARSMQAAQLILRRTAIDEGVRGARNAPLQAGDFLRKQIDGAPQLRELSIADVTGQLVATSELSDFSHVNVAARAYFQNLQHANGDAIAISEPVISLLDHKPALPMALRLHDTNDRFTGVVVASIEPGYFRNFYEQIDLTPGTRIRLLGSSGEPISGYERLPSTPGSDARSVVHAVEGYPLKIEVSRANSAILAAWHATVFKVLTRSVLISLFIALLARFLIKQLRRVRQMNEQLRSSEHRLRTVFENAPIGIVVLSGQRYVAANPAFQHMVGYSEAELAKMRVADITYPEDENLTQLYTSEIVKSVCFQARYVHRDGHIVRVDIRAARIAAWRQQAEHASSGDQEYMIATVEDITARLEEEQQRQRLEQQLRQSQKLEALGTFAGGVAHDFNNILGAILGYGERALSLLDERTSEHRYVEQVMKAGDRARLLVDRILTFSRSGTTARVAVDARSVVAEVTGLLKATLPEGIALEVQLDDEDMFVLGDPTHLHQVVMNLCSNAVHAMPKGGVLRVTLKRVHLDMPRTLSHGAVNEGDYVELGVADSGVGISACVLERMFNPFFTTRKAGEGTGLGLSLVDGIVREHGGAIDVGTEVGVGTRFFVYLPLTDALPAGASPGSEALPHGEGQVVLLVDDEETLVTLGEEVLAELGYEPVGFHSAVSAWQAFQQEPERFDVVVTDQTMPDMTGLELVEQIRTLRPDLPVILCSGFSTAPLEEATHELGMLAVLHKPLRQADLANALERAFHPTSAH
ncbi:PAS domain S-box (plasmid) [Paraburkholderia caribensis MBA4]|uniref:histidine kinase n=1 Tax=Paraburkholderia caribensis MBA4 TaxID=1323664 RepID=A0A0P0RMZ9_9BURK|nr:ATP-binding protein [Paraburkholderia caribensis]ALL70312.1 PAS domain S-box [Paraburkholderia caribensis MBA4]